MKTKKKSLSKPCTTIDKFELVFGLVKKIPTGKVTNYGAIGDCLGLSPRVVGWAMNAAHAATTTIPAHRVVNRNGLLTGKHHFATPTLMQELLENENIKIVNDKIINFEKHFWHPCPKKKNLY